jgi:purine-nucleoside phosphorylase
MEAIREAATHVGGQTKHRPSVAVVLGSGLGAFADAVDAPTALSYGTIPHFPTSTALSHAGKLVVGSFQKVPLYVMAGRVHAYEGYDSADVAFPIRVLGALGVKIVVLTNAAGAINTAYRPGELMILTDHINLSGKNPLVGPEIPELGPRFTDMTRAYDDKLVEATFMAGRRIGLNLRKGVYAGLLGPSYETPAEIRMLRTMGADAVGMSTVLEAIAARQQGVRVVGLSCITNMAAGILPEPIDHREVIEIGERVRSVMVELLTELLPALHKQA